MVTTPCFPCSRCRFDPWFPGQGTKILHAGLAQWKKERNTLVMRGEGMNANLDIPFHPCKLWTSDFSLFRRSWRASQGERPKTWPSRRSRNWSNMTWRYMDRLCEQHMQWVEEPSALVFLTSEKKESNFIFVPLPSHLWKLLTYLYEENLWLSQELMFKKVSLDLQRTEFLSSLVLYVY